MEQSFYDKIDILRDKFNNKKPININDTCFILWAEHCVCSDVYLKFKSYIKNNKTFNRKKLEFCIWFGIFKSWSDEYLT